MRNRKLEVTYSLDAVSLLPPATLHSNGAELSWTKYTGLSGAPFQHYAVYRSATPGFAPSLSTLLTVITDPPVTSYGDTTAAPGRAFSYAVVANGSESNEITVTLPRDGRATKTVQPEPGTAQDTFIYYASDISNCGNWLGWSRLQPLEPVAPLDVGEPERPRRPVVRQRDDRSGTATEEHQPARPETLHDGHLQPEVGPARA